MRRDELERKITAILVEHLGVTADQVQHDTLLVPDHTDRGVKIDSGRPDLGADSLDVVELCMAIEEAFGFQVPDEQAELINTATVRQLFDMVATLEVCS